MNKYNEYIKSYIDEIISAKDSECVIDKNDMDSFVDRNNIIDGFKIEVTIDNILDKLAETLNGLLERNKFNKCNEIIFSLYHAETAEVNLGILDRIIDILRTTEDVDILWKTSNKKDLEPGKLEMIVLIGFE